MNMAYEQETSQPFRWHYAEFDDSNFQIRGRTLFFILVLFAVIVVVALLFLYARWVCRSAAPPPPQTTTSTSAARHAPPLRGLDAAAISSLPIVLHKINNPAPGGGCGGGGDEFSEAECSICLGIFVDGEKVKVLPECNHCYHSECVDKWLTTQSNCPLCRASLRVDSPV